PAIRYKNDLVHVGSGICAVERLAFGIENLRPSLIDIADALIPDPLDYWRSFLVRLCNENIKAHPSNSSLDCQGRRRSPVLASRCKNNGYASSNQSATNIPVRANDRTAANHRIAFGFDRQPSLCQFSWTFLI